MIKGSTYLMENSESWSLTRWMYCWQSMLLAGCWAVRLHDLRNLVAVRWLITTRFHQLTSDVLGAKILYDIMLYREDLEWFNHLTGSSKTWLIEALPGLLGNTILREWELLSKIFNLGNNKNMTLGTILKQINMDTLGGPHHWESLFLFHNALNSDNKTRLLGNLSLQHENFIRSKLCWKCKGIWI